MGHPLAGQSIEVQLTRITTVLPGCTGNAHEIEAVLTFLSPAQLPVVLGTFENYFDPDPVSTNLLLPCYGPGRVAFVPVDGGPLARPWDESVSFFGQP
jgi:hypothetical protein